MPSDHQAGAGASQSGPQKRVSKSTGSAHKFVLASCPTMEIEINNTPDAMDDLVQLKCTRPSHQHKVECRIKIIGTPPGKDAPVVLTNPDGRLRFSVSGARTKNLTVPRNGSWAAFQIYGEAKSLVIGDAVIQAHCGTEKGEVKASRNVTVFWFDAAKIEVTPQGAYSITGSAYGPVGGGVNYSAQATIKPNSVNCSAPQIVNLKVGILQNLRSSTRQITWGAPTMLWSPSAPINTVARVPTQLSQTLSIPHPLNDSEASVAPLYDQPGKPTTINANSLKPPIGCSGGGAAESSDAPTHSAPPTTTRNVLNSAGALVGVATYTLDNVTIHDEFTTYTVIFDTGTNEMCALRERTWNVNVSSSAAAPQQASAAAADSDPTASPVTSAPYPNDVGAAAHPPTDPVGSAMTTLTKTH